MMGGIDFRAVQTNYHSSSQNDFSRFWKKARPRLKNFERKSLEQVFLTVFKLGKNVFVRAAGWERQIS